MRGYKITILVTFFAVFSIVNLGVAKIRFSFGSPKIVCENPVFDFGTLESGTSFRHSFVISNAGNASLELSRVRACCGTTASLTDKSVSPGATSVLNITYLVKGHNREIIKEFPIKSNDPDQPNYKIRLTGKSISSVRAVPQVVMLENIVPGTVETTKFSVLCYSNIAIRITNITVTTKHLSATYLKNIKTNAHVIKIRTLPDLPTGTTRGDVLVLTDSPQFPEIFVPVFITIASDMVVVPKKIILMNSKGNPEPVSSSVLIRSRSNKRFSISKIEVPNFMIKTKLIPIDSGGYQIIFSNIVPDETLDGNDFVITIKNSGLEKIVIPVHAIFHEPDLNL